MHVLVSIKLSHSLVQEVLLEVGLGHSDQELSNEATDGKLDINVAVVIARMLTPYEPEELQDVEPVSRLGLLAANCLLWRNLSQEFGNDVH